MEQALDYTSDIELDNQQTYDQINQEEINEILAEPGLTNENEEAEEANSNNREQQEQQDEQQAIKQPDNAITDDEDENKTVATESSRPTRERKEPERSINKSGTITSRSKMKSGNI
jgi:hypothetical protein